MASSFQCVAFLVECPVAAHEVHRLHLIERRKQPLLRYLHLALDFSDTDRLLTPAQKHPDRLNDRGRAYHCLVPSTPMTANASSSRATSCSSLLRHNAQASSLTPTIGRNIFIATCPGPAGICIAVGGAP